MTARQLSRTSSLWAGGSTAFAPETALEGTVWQDWASCAETDPEAFFPEKGDSTLPAKKVCLGCCVQAECLEYSIETDQKFGVWGGLSAQERRRLRRTTEQQEDAA